MRVLVCGSRTINNPRPVCEALNCLWGLHRVMCQEMLVVVHGGCSAGPDRHAQDWYETMYQWNRDVGQEVFMADWKTHGKAAGPIRNSVMIGQDIDLVLAFWDGVSRGTANMVELAIQRKVPYLLRTL